MQAKIERAVLLRCLGHIQSVVERRNTIPILSNVLIEAMPGGGGDGVIRVMATDLDMQIVETVEAKVETAGATTVSAHLLFEIARKLPEGSEVSLIAADGEMRVAAGRYQSKLKTLPRDDFPIIAAGDQGSDFPCQFEMAAKDIIAIIEKTRFAISTEETRYYLNGIFLHVTDEGADSSGGLLRAAATDGHRLARYTLPRPAGAESMPDVILPRKCVNELHKLLQEVGETQVQVELSPSKVRFTLGSAVLTSKLIDGTFPDYARVIPTGNDKLLRVDPKAFGQGVDRVATIASDKTRAVKMAVDTGRITLSVTSPENGTASEEISGEYSAEPIEIGFNAKYLSDIIAQIDEDSVELHLADAAAPTLIRESADSPALYVLMPMRV
ncbi:MAG: DNA polymerase III subunit beta [Sphingopyxis sp.]